MSILHMAEEQVNTTTVNELNQDIAEYLEASSDQYMDDVIRDDSRLSVWQLLSELRCGLISWYDFKENAEVLEIGAGFGALTGLLCEKCAHVTATERSAFRAQKIAERYEDVNNLDVYAGDVMDMTLPHQFDYILLVGILEVIGKGTADLGVYIDYVHKLRGLLKEQGKLLIAVDNRMGLRYFCGESEPYTKKAFAGINHYKRGTRGYTFTKKQLEEIVAGAGFENHKFYYPLPDYKFPQLIYTDDYMPENNLKERLIPYYNSKDTLVAFELELYDDVIANGMFPAMANSFLIECSLDAQFEKTEYAAISTDRGRERSFATVIYKEDTRKVKKMFLYPQGRMQADLLMENIEDLKQHGIPVVPHSWDENGVILQPYIEYPTLSNVLKKVIRTDVAEFERILDCIYHYILQSSEETQRNAFLERLLEDVANDENLTADVKQQKKTEWGQLDFGPVLKKAYMELIPLNCFYAEADDSFLYFDQEFVRRDYPAQYVMFRAIHYIYCFTERAEQYYPKQKLIDRYGMHDTWDLYLQEERRFLDEVRNHKRYEQFYKWAAVDGKRVLDNAQRLESESERIADYVVSDKMKKIWKIELQMLDEIDRICKKYGLQYFLVHGSLLGAVRHGGFIPWDDDVDVAMPRADYDTFIEVAAKELSEVLSVHTPMTEKDLFWGNYARIRHGETTAMLAQDLNHEGNQGIWVDILPYDVCTMNERLYAKKEKKICQYYSLLAAKTYGGELPQAYGMGIAKWKTARLFSHFYSRKYLAQKLEWAARLYTDEESLDIAFFTGCRNFRRLSAKDFASQVYMNFAKRKLPVPVGYENYLFTIMGKDYMKYPPKEEQKPRHAGIWDPDVVYTRYQKMLCHMFEGVKGKKLILWGSGLMFEDYMKKYGGKYRPDYLIDNDENKWGRFRMGIEICSPQKLTELSKDKYHLIICSFYYKEIEKQLKAMGITDYKIYIQRKDWILEAENK